MIYLYPFSDNFEVVSINYKLQRNVSLASELMSKFFALFSLSTAWNWFLISWWSVPDDAPVMTSHPLPSRLPAIHPLALHNHHGPTVCTMHMPCTIIMVLQYIPSTCLAQSSWSYSMYHPRATHNHHGPTVCTIQVLCTIIMVLQYIPSTCLHNHHGHTVCTIQVPCTIIMVLLYVPSTCPSQSSWSYSIYHLRAPHNHHDPTECIIHVPCTIIMVLLYIPSTCPAQSSWSYTRLKNIKICSEAITSLKTSIDVNSLFLLDYPPSRLLGIIISIITQAEC